MLCVVYARISHSTNFYFLTTTTNTIGLLSDANGYIKIDFYYDAGINEATSDVGQQNKLLSAAAGVKSFSIQNIDSSSYASGKIELKNYTTITETPAAVVPAYTPTTNARIAGEYDYTNNFADIVDYNRFASTSGSDNITHVNWTGQSSYVSGFNRSGFSDNEQLV